MKVLIVDTETSQLVSTLPLENFYILQLSWIVYDTDTETSEENDFILHCPIPITNSHIHGITDEMSAEGYQFSEIIDIFLEDVQFADILCGYNLNYDLHALEIELDRLARYHDIDILFSKKHIDVMKRYSSLNKCKYLKLTDLYHKLFSEDFPAHNAIQDVKATLRIYLNYRNYF